VNDNQLVCRPPLKAATDLYSGSVWPSQANLLTVPTANLIDICMIFMYVRRIVPLDWPRSPDSYVLCVYRFITVGL
jgi:hypothetical protein